MDIPAYIPSSSSFVSYSFHFLFLSCLLSALYTSYLFNLVAHYSEEKAFCIEKKTTELFFLFFCLTTNICAPLQRFRKDPSGSLLHCPRRLHSCVCVRAHVFVCVYVRMCVCVSDRA